MIKWQTKRNRREKIINYPSSSTIFSWPDFLPTQKSAFGESFCPSVCLLSLNVNFATCYKCLSALTYLYSQTCVFTHILSLTSEVRCFFILMDYSCTQFTIFWHIDNSTNTLTRENSFLLFLLSKNLWTVSGFYVSLPSIDITVKLPYGKRWRCSDMWRLGSNISHNAKTVAYFHQTPYGSNMSIWILLDL